MNLLSNVLAVTHHLTSVAAKLHGDLNAFMVSLKPMYFPSAPDLPHANSRDSKALDEIAIIHPHPGPEAKVSIMRTLKVWQDKRGGCVYNVRTTCSRAGREVVSE